MLHRWMLLSVQSLDSSRAVSFGSSLHMAQNGAAVPLFRFAFYVYRHSGRTGGVPVTIGIAPPPMLMAGRSHCLRRFYHARTVTERKFHYIQMIAAELPCVRWTLLYLRRWCFSLLFRYALFSAQRKIVAHPPSGSLYAAACGMYPACPLFDFQGSAKNKNISLISLFIFGADSGVRQSVLSIFQCFSVQM